MRRGNQRVDAGEGTLRLAFFPFVLARRALASLSISFSSSSMSTGSGRAGLASGFGSISPGRSLRAERGEDGVRKGGGK